MSLDHLDALDGAVQRMERALASAPAAAPVSTCPEWTVADLTAHLISVHRWAASIVLSTRGQDFPDVRREDDLPAWYARSARALLAALDAVDPGESCWTMNWDVDPTAGFWRRRQLHETVMHTVDVQLAAGASPDPIEPAIAVDGVNEVLTRWLPIIRRRSGRFDLPAPVSIRASDTADAWLLTPEPGEAPSVSAGVSHDTYVAGTAADIYLALWKREAGPLDVQGEAAERFLAGRLTP